MKNYTLTLLLLFFVAILANAKENSLLDSETSTKDGLIIETATGKIFTGEIKFKSKDLDITSVVKEGRIIQQTMYDKTATPYSDRFIDVILNRKPIYILPISIGVLLLFINLFVIIRYFIKKKSKNPTKLFRIGFRISIFLMCTLFIYAFFSTSKEISRESTRRLSCDGHLSQIGLALRMYSDTYDGHFPHLDGAKGLDLLRTTGYLDFPQYFVCPSGNTKLAKRGEPLTEKHLDYIYRGGYSENDNPKIGILYDKQHNHYKFGNILFVDGSYKGFYGSNWQKHINPNKEDSSNSDSADAKSE